MLDTLILLPAEFWLVTMLFAFGILVALGNLRQGSGLPMLVVLATVFFWYVGDVLYNDYPENHYLQFSQEVLNSTWMQISGFLLTFYIFVGISQRRKKSQISLTYTLYQDGVRNTEYQLLLNRFMKMLLVIYAVIVLFVIINIGVKSVDFVFSILGNRVNPFARGRIGGGISAILALGHYLLLLVGAGFAIVAALSTNPRTRKLAIIGCILVLPYFLFSRTRSNMLVVFLPGLLAWVFLRLRISNFQRTAILLAMLLIVSSWFAFVMLARSHGSAVSRFVESSEVSTILMSEERHAGLNMYEELCWMNTFIKDGTYVPGWGKRYFAELVNPIPRALWPDKPMIALDYAVARGQMILDDSKGITATISTGMIGQAISDFGIYLGPIVIGFLMATWVFVLAKIDTDRRSYIRQPLFLVGLVLTFNMGRDVTLLVLYPFIFGMLAIYLIESIQRSQSSMRVTA